MRILAYIKPGLAGLIFFAISSNAFSQLQGTGSGSSGAIRNTGVTIVNDRLGDNTDTRLLQGGGFGQQSFLAISASGGLKLPDMSGIQGSPFLHPTYNTAYVRLQSGKSATVPVLFNLYGNEIIFLQYKSEMALDSVDYVHYTVTADGKTEDVRLKSGYAPIAGHDKNTIYQILDSNSQVQLLKFTSKTIEEIKSMGMAPKKEFVAKDEYYVFTPQGGMKKIKLDKSSIQDALPESASDIEAIISERKLKLKKEADLIELFKQLSARKKGF